MSSVTTKDSTQVSNSGTASKKKNNKKKKTTNRAKDLSQAGSEESRPHNDDNDEEEPESPTKTDAPDNDTIDGGVSHNNESNGHVDGPTSTTTTHLDNSDASTTAKLEAVSKERDSLRLEIDSLRKRLEDEQEAHDKELLSLRSEVEDSNSAKEEAEEKYENLLGRVEKIKATLSDRLKRDKADLEEAKERIDELEAENEELRSTAASSGGNAAKLREELQDATRELSTLRSRNNLSAQNWQKERDEMARQISHLKQELETTSNAMGEWEVIAMEERSVKESLQDKMADLEEQIASLRAGFEDATQERDSQTTLVDNLQNALREIQDARKKELRELVESTDRQLEAQQRLRQEAEARASEALAAKETLSTELERTAPFEKEVREKNLLIGKLRHEAIVLNDHLTKALRYLKKTKPEDNVDRQVVTNHLLHFLTLDRGDVKRFQVLQVMAGYLNWTDEQREQAGLSRPGTSSNSLRLPTSPFNRTPSSPSLNADIFTEPTSSARDKESLAELWAGFLERSAQEGVGGDAGSSSRKGSVSSIATGSGKPDPGSEKK